QQAAGRGVDTADPDLSGPGPGSRQLPVLGQPAREPGVERVAVDSDLQELQPQSVPSPEP
ncbi:MAG: hypothetical protein M3Z50_05360, partial [Actinomycetota bacterium]|nr:hypothetical protein [Actinomycetota bacterium]